MYEFIVGHCSEVLQKTDLIKNTLEIVYVVQQHFPQTLNGIAEFRSLEYRVQYHDDLSGGIRSHE